MTASSRTAPPWVWPELGRTLRFCAMHAPQVLVAPLLLVLYGTFAHELAHAAAALVQGGTVTSFSFLPSSDALGMTSYEPPAAGPFSHELVALAPYLLWGASAGAIALVAALPGNRMSPALSTTIYTWGYAMPIGDIALNLYAGHGDLAVPGVEGLLVVAVGTGLLGCAYALGFVVQRGLYRERAVSAGGYLVSTAILGVAMGAAGLCSLALFAA